MTDGEPTPPKKRRGAGWWGAWAVGLGCFTAAMLALARLLGWLSRAQIDYLAN